MLRTNQLSVLIGLSFLMMINSNTVFADSPPPISINCKPLEPKDHFQENIELKVQGKVDAITRAFLNSEGKAEVKIVKNDLFYDMPNVDKIALAQMFTYLFCQTIMNERRVSPYSDRDSIIVFFQKTILPLMQDSDKVVPKSLHNKIIKLKANGGFYLDDVQPMFNMAVLIAASPQDLDELEKEKNPRIILTIKTAKDNEISMKPMNDLVTLNSREGNDDNSEDIKYYDGFYLGEERTFEIFGARYKVKYINYVKSKKETVWQFKRLN